MPSPNWYVKTNSLSGRLPVIAVEVVHANLPQPIRFVNDDQDITIVGDLFTATAFSLKPPSDPEFGRVIAEVSIDNVGRELTQWLEVSAGGAGATIRVLEVMPDAPNVIETDLTFDLTNVRQNMLRISGKLAFKDMHSIPAVVSRYLPSTHPGLY